MAAGPKISHKHNLVSDPSAFTTLALLAAFQHGNEGSNPARTVLASLRAAGPGFEPGFLVPETSVLPLDDPAKLLNHLIEYQFLVAFSKPCFSSVI